MFLQRGFLCLFVVLVSALSGGSQSIMDGAYSFPFFLLSRGVKKNKREEKKNAPRKEEKKKDTC